MQAIKYDILPDRQVCKLFGIPSEEPELERAIFGCYEAAVVNFGVTEEQIVDAYMCNTMDKLILDNHPAIRNSFYGQQVIASNGIKLERFPGVP